MTKDEIAEISLKILAGIMIVLLFMLVSIMIHRAYTVFAALTSPPTPTGTEQVEYTIDGYFDTTETVSKSGASYGYTGGQFTYFISPNRQSTTEAKHYIYLKDEDGVIHTFEIPTDALAMLARKNGETITVTKTTLTHQVYGEEITYDWNGFTLTYIGTETGAEE